MPNDAAMFVPTYTHSFYPGQVFPILGPTPADVARELERLVDVGVSHFPLGFAAMTSLQRFVDEVVPIVRLQPEATD